MDCSFLGAVIVEGRPVGVLFSTGRLEASTGKKRNTHMFRLTG